MGNFNLQSHFKPAGGPSTRSFASVRGKSAFIYKPYE